MAMEALAPALQARHWVQQWATLDGKEKAIMGDLHKVVEHSLHSQLRGMREMWEDRAGGQRALQQLRERLRGEAAGIRKLVAELKSQLVHAVPGQDYVEALASVIDKMESSLGSLKARQAAEFEELMEEEERLEQEIEAVAFRLEQEAFEQDAEPPASTTEHSNRLRRASSAAAAPQADLHGERALAPEVVEYERFVAQTGETGGWDEPDHREFEKIVKACKGDYVVAVEAVCERMLGYTREEIVQHAHWHMNCLDLAVRKRMALARWRVEKEAERARVHAQAAQPEAAGASGAGAGGGGPQQQQQAAWEAQYAEHRKQLVAQWKAAKEEQQRQAAEAQAQRQAARQEEERRKREARQALNKARLEARRRAQAQAQREAVHQQQLQAHLEAVQKAVSPVARLNVQLRNEAALRRKQELLQEKQKAAGQRVAAQEALAKQAAVTAPRDPARLLRPTSAHNVRVAANQAEPLKPKDSGFVLQMAHRATPNWMAR